MIFVNGCFWHGHGCRKKNPVRTNRSYWMQKVTRNRQRDRRNVMTLKRAGWDVLTLWECEVDSLGAALKPRLRKFLLVPNTNICQAS